MLVLSQSYQSENTGRKSHSSILGKQSEESASMDSEQTLCICRDG
ncbi:hypothetical protein A2U01_0062849 [Trifolium medium]|uniref:Uncharacterized protein n=1 Tax=Trifolium medium TaxID=97028 RepID=A0A392S1B1_9FABA|nr:hypothetical protein [Trifolium medium]